MKEPEIREHVSLAPLTSFHIGGEARYFIDAKSVDDVSAAVRFAKEHSLPLFILGGGSNLLISEKGYDGVVVRIEISDISVIKKETHGTCVSWVYISKSVIRIS